jgi:hypothetical protein
MIPSQPAGFAEGKVTWFRNFPADHTAKSAYKVGPFTCANPGPFS